MTRLRKYALEKYGPSWLSFCLPPVENSIAPQHVSPACHLNCSPWDVITPREVSNSDQEAEIEMKNNLESKDELRDDNTMAITESITRTETEPGCSSKGDDDKKKKEKMMAGGSYSDGRKHQKKIVVDKEKPEPVDFTVRRVCKNEFYYYDEEDDEEEEKKVGRKKRKKGVV